MRRFVIRWLVVAVALYVAVRFVPGINYDGGWETLALMALIVGFVNAVIRPILAILTCPLQILTLGIFTLVLNGAMLYLAAALARGLGIGFYVNGFGAAFLGALVVSIVTVLLSALLGEDDDHDEKRHHH